eukprot:SAG31_NODE_39735_length_286_cov_0.556150_1_plen_72_part_01
MGRRMVGWAVRQLPTLAIGAAAPDAVRSKHAIVRGGWSGIFAMPGLLGRGRNHRPAGPEGRCIELALRGAVS